MELSEESIRKVIYPTAARKDLDDDFAEQSPHSHEPVLEDVAAWRRSRLNPANRIDSLEPLAEPLWRLDGCTAFGTQIFAIPLFVGIVRPYRVDVFIPEPAKLSPELYRMLDLDVAFYTRDGPSFNQLGIARHVLRILQHWTMAMNEPWLVYRNLPSGSRIVLHNLPINVADACISIAPTHYLERQLLSVSTLRGFWGAEVTFPPSVDIDRVEYISQLHDSVCLVRIDGTTVIFKALTSYTKYLYHELRQLLIMEPHPNIVARPIHLVTKRCSFGNKVAVVGFTLVYHSQGSFRDLVPFLDLHGHASNLDKTKWSLQLTSALSHLRETLPDSFYTDLRLDNIVLSDSRQAVMVDFEQRGVWCDFAAPEVNAFEAFRLLETDDAEYSESMTHAGVVLNSHFPEWRDMIDGEDYIWPNRGYNVPWTALTPTERESCEVYMLGRVLWCIFEGKSAPQRAAVWLSYRWEPLVDFPRYTKTPEPMRNLIDRCTRGRRPNLSQYIVRERGKLVLRDEEEDKDDDKDDDKKHKDKDDGRRSTAAKVRRVAHEWWVKEVSDSLQWLDERTRRMRAGDWSGNYYGRPTLRQVRDALQAYHDDQVMVVVSSERRGGAV